MQVSWCTDLVAHQCFMKILNQVINPLYVLDVGKESQDVLLFLQ